MRSRASLLMAPLHLLNRHRFDIHMQKTLAPTAASARFDLAPTGLTNAQLKAIAGARPVVNTFNATVQGVTKCCG
jgi:hypothetical protein